MKTRVTAAASTIGICFAIAICSAPALLAQGLPKGAEAGCDTACRAAKANPRPKFVSPEVGKDGRVTVRIFAPKANSIAIGGLQPLNENGESEFAAAIKGDDGIWTYVSPPWQPGTYSYSVRIDGVDAYDPSNLWVVPGRLNLQNIVEIGGGEEFARFDPGIPHGAVAEVLYRSPGAEFDRRMRVYTPPGYGSRQETLPVLILLHGGGHAEDFWPKLGRANLIIDKLIAQGKARRMIVAMIDGYVDDYTKPSGVDPNLTTEDLMKGALPYLESNYTVAKESKDRAIAGLSRGAAQTMTIVRAHPDQFAYVGVFSFARSRIGPFRKEMEAMNDADWTRFGDIVSRHRYFYWTVGTEDGGVPDSKAVWELYKRKNINIIAETRPGNHEWLVWRAALRDFAQNIFQ